MATDLTTDSSGDLVFDGTPFFRAYKDGRVERLMGTDVVPAGVDHATGVASKDVVIDPGTGVWVRLYLPPSLGADHPNTRLPVLVYFHGGGFSIESAASPTYHAYLNAVAARARVVAVSVDYRRVPEHPIPAAYDDSWVALRWVASHAGSANGSEPWLVEHGDLRRVFLAGDSAGANIAHNMAVRAGGGRGGGVGADAPLLLVGGDGGDGGGEGADGAVVEVHIPVGVGEGAGGGVRESDGGRGAGGDGGDGGPASAGVLGGEGLPERAGAALLRGAAGERVPGGGGGDGVGRGGARLPPCQARLPQGRGDDGPHGRLPQQVTTPDTALITPPCVASGSTEA